MTRTKTPRARKSKESVIQAEREAEWRRKLEQGEHPLKTYVINQTYHLDDRVKHDTFGIGLVVELIPPGKINVFFEDGVKLMKCGE